MSSYDANLHPADHLSQAALDYWGVSRLNLEKKKRSIMSATIPVAFAKATVSTSLQLHLFTFGSD
jgi:hypothetical protein